MNYDEFLRAKAQSTPREGRAVTPGDIHPMLHPWQANLVAWAVETGRAAIWADTGLGKTLMQLEWARLSGDTPLIIAPLAVCQQTVREAGKVGITAEYVREWDDVNLSGMVDVHVTNYERLQNFTPSAFDAVVLDESSILKQSDGKTRSMLIDWARRLLSDLALWLCRLQSRGPLSGSVFAAQVSPMLEAAFERAADFRDIEAAQREAAEAKAIAQQTEARLDAIEGKHDWFSAIAYAHLHQLPTSTQFLQRLGSCAARIGRSHGVEPTQVQHQLWGWVNSWPAWVWDLAAEGFDR